VNLLKITSLIKLNRKETHVKRLAQENNILEAESRRV
jgi:hypothetical protein